MHRWEERKKKWEKEELLVSILNCRYGGTVERGKEKIKKKRKEREDRR